MESSLMEQGYTQDEAHTITSMLERLTSIIMVKLINIEKSGGEITCEALLEDCVKPVRLVYDIAEKTIQYDALPEGYEYCVSHIGHARRTLERMVKENKIEPQITVMWY